ncbi:putative N-acetyltransferase YoaP [Gottschalkia acidurici 9a]|uniref:N-acetyltransferase YoaP n=1 Tax=Gottschalkia acidurici (strain ATCC 7906 / DSM 604 / BCRC 14475 / CIP 104303 / KCTC 5404 / NCIMB 10678 / 9a) TaxID=1128398 RepID=K0AXM9_GOTA9|nr:N-acetyltransferase [Gottschalkia acidurici]AFS77495.1 putative N-acetyltransferase YoaP [Gottschalkia acidurici 9a]
MNIITVDSENLEKEHICCAIADKKGECQVASKKAWLKERFKDGLTFKKADVRGKVFIEYIPAENAWCPIVADGYMFINCLWVSGKYKGQGISTKLLNECIIDSKSKGKKGLVILSSKKKIPYISDPKFLSYKGFIVADNAEPYYQLMYLPFEENEEKPYFKSCAKAGKIEEKGFVLYYSNQCPFTAKYVPLIEEIAKDKKIEFKVIKYETTEQAQNAPAPFTTYSLFYNGEFITNDILSDKKFEKILEEKGL